MPERSPNSHTNVQLTQAEIEAVDAAARGRGISKSRVVEEAVEAFLRAAALAETGLTKPALDEVPTRQRGYLLSPAVVDRLKAARRRYGFAYVDVVRAALQPIVRARREREGEG
jgi:hypothetical protein